jgi:hypothetical protein
VCYSLWGSNYNGNMNFLLLLFQSVKDRYDWLSGCKHWIY